MRERGPGSSGQDCAYVRMVTGHARDSDHRSSSDCSGKAGGDTSRSVHSTVSTGTDTARPHSRADVTCHSGGVQVSQVVVGSEQHGVTQTALSMARTCAWRHQPVVRVADPRGWTAQQWRVALGGARRAHVHFTDRQWGDDPARAAAALGRLAAQVDLSVTLHDLPQASDGPTNHARRARAYCDIVRACTVVLVSSQHEEQLLLGALSLVGGIDPDPRRLVCSVVPLPIPDLADPGRGPGPRVPEQRGRDIAIFGYLYPGKGHHEVARCLPALPADVWLNCLGRPAPGHDDVVADLREYVATLGRRTQISGYVATADLGPLLGAATIPVAPHTHISASGSINMWIAAGRRPLTPDNRYTRELDQRQPGVVAIYDDLATALRTALADPGSTWLDRAPSAVASTEESYGSRCAELVGL